MACVYHFLMCMQTGQISSKTRKARRAPMVVNSAAYLRESRIRQEMVYTSYFVFLAPTGGGVYIYSVPIMG